MAAGAVLTAKQTPHRPGTAPALALRAGDNEEAPALPAAGGRSRQPDVFRYHKALLGEPVMAAVDYFLKVDDVPGESGDAKHKDEIQVLSFSFGESQAGTMAFGGGGGAGKVQMQDFHFLMNVNKASPKLFLACATGQHIKSAVLTARKAGKVQEDYLKVTFNDLLVSSFQTNGDANANSLPVDSISLNFAEVEIEYKVQNVDGSLGGATKVKYNLKEMQSK
jgi:type VI secretion system secreted protein Hcp